MKKIFTLFVIVSIAQTTKAQFANTSWLGNFKIPDETQMLLHFTQDSLLLSYATSAESVERSTYKITGDTLSMVKIDGISPCSIADSATYKIELREGKLYITSLVDYCYERATAWPDEGMIKKE